MMEVFGATLSPMLVLFCCILIGFVLNKLKLLPDNASNVLSKLENCVLVPALIINTFMKYSTLPTLKAQSSLISYSVIIVCIALLIAYLFSGFFEKDAYKKNIYKYALAFGNFGFMGNAIVPAILGEEFLFDYMLFTLPLNLVVYTWGATILIPYKTSGKETLKKLINPVVCSLLLGVFLGIFEIEKYLPDFVTTTIGNLSSCMGPIAMILTGFVIGNYDIKELLKNKKIYFVTFLRLFVLPTLYILLLFFLNADTETMLLCLFAFATPLGLNTVIFPAAYNADTSTGASMSMISHTLSVISIPIMYTLLRCFV